MLTVSADDIMRSPWLWDVAPFRIADNLYYVGNKDVSCYLFDPGEWNRMLDNCVDKYNKLQKEDPIA